MKTSCIEIIKVLLGNSLVLSIIGTSISLYYTHVSKKKLQEQSQKHEYLLRTEMYYKNISSENIGELFIKWMDLIDTIHYYKKSKEQIDELIEKMIYDVCKYGSSETIKVAVEFQCFYYNYKYEVEKLCSNEVENFEEIQEDYTVELIAYLSILISRLKKDFTGHSIPYDIFFKIKISDYEQKKEKCDAKIKHILKKLNLDDENTKSK